MTVQNELPPIIIKKKKVVGGGGHHGGAWKVAYADFVTAMMAFFLLMWLLNATTEQQRKGIADYFSPTVPIARISGGGDGSFGGDSVFSETTAAQNGTGGSDQRPTEGRQSLGMSGTDHSDELEQAALEALEDALLSGGGDARLSESELSHIQTRVSDFGLVIEIFAREGAPLFDADSHEATPLLRGLSDVMSELFDTVTNDIAISGHVRSEPIVVAEETRWEVSTGHAQSFRELLQGSGTPAHRFRRVTGYADRNHTDSDPMSVRNDRLTITLLRSGF